MWGLAYALGKPRQLDTSSRCVKAESTLLGFFFCPQQDKAGDVEVAIP